MPPLFYALQMNAMDSFLHLVQIGAEISTTWRGQSLLHFLAHHREISEIENIISTLTGRGFDLEALDDRGNTPFLSAVSLGRFDLVFVLAQQGANVHARDRIGGNAFSVLVNSPLGVRNLDLARYLFELGLDFKTDISSRIESPLKRLQRFARFSSTCEVFGPLLALLSTQNQPEPRIDSLITQDNNPLMNPEAQEIHGTDVLEASNSQDESQEASTVPESSLAPSTLPAEVSQDPLVPQDDSSTGQEEQLEGVGISF